MEPSCWFAQCVADGRIIYWLYMQLIIMKILLVAEFKRIHQAAGRFMLFAAFTLFQDGDGIQRFN